MKQRKITLLIIGLSALIFLMSALAYKFYAKSSELSTHLEEQVPIIVAKRDIKKGALITKNDLTQQLLPKSYIGFAPLTPAEVYGKYAKVDILKSEPFRIEKISYEKPDMNVTYKLTEESKKSVECMVPIELNSTVDTITLELSMFRNFDTTLKVEDKIDIMSVVPKSASSSSSRYGARSTEQKFETKYIALAVPIVSFISNGEFVKNAVSTIKDKNTGQTISKRADKIVLELKPNELSNFLSLYYSSQALNSQKVYNVDNRYTGHLWIINSTLNEDEKALRFKKEMMYDYKRVVKKRKAIKRKKRAKKIKKEKVLIDYEN